MLSGQKETYPGVLMIKTLNFKNDSTHTSFVPSKNANEYEFAIKNAQIETSRGTEINILKYKD